MDEKKAADPTPEQLLKLLDIQLAQSRQRRVGSEARRTTFRIVSVLVLILGTLGAVWLLMYLAEDLRNSRAAQNPPAESR